MGVVHNFCFHAGRLAQHNDDILDMINQLPDIENKTSFLSLCMTSEGVQWGEHKDIEQLVALGIASGNLEYCYPREMWPTKKCSEILVINYQYFFLINYCFVV